jgi:hypothetical protein
MMPALGVPHLQLGIRYAPVWLAAAAHWEVNYNQTGSTSDVMWDEYRDVYVQIRAAVEHALGEPARLHYWAWPPTFQIDLPNAVNTHLPNIHADPILGDDQVLRRRVQGVLHRDAFNSSQPPSPPASPPPPSPPASATCDWAAQKTVVASVLHPPQDPIRS